MAELVGVIASALTIGGVAASAAQLSLALFTVAQTLKNAPQEIAEIAEEISLLSGSLLTLADSVETHSGLFKPALYNNTKLILARYNQVDDELRRLIDTPAKLARLKWFVKRPKAKILLKKVEGIKTALTLELNIVRLAREEVIRPQPTLAGTTRTIHKPNRFRKIVESAVQANRQVVESAQRPNSEDVYWQRKPIGKELEYWTEDSFDTATWLYHLIFSLEVPAPPTTEPTNQNSRYQASVSDEPTERTIDVPHTSSTHATMPIQGPSSFENRAMIVWSRQTEPSLVVDRLLSDWTTLTPQQIDLSSTRHDGDDWRESFDKMVVEAKEEEDLEAKKEAESDAEAKSVQTNSKSSRRKSEGTSVPVEDSSTNTSEDETEYQYGYREPYYELTRTTSRYNNPKPWSDTVNSSKSVPLYGKSNRQRASLVDSETRYSGTQQTPTNPQHPRKVRWQDDDSDTERPEESVYSHPRYVEHGHMPTRSRSVSSHNIESVSDQAPRFSRTDYRSVRTPSATSISQPERLPLSGSNQVDGNSFRSDHGVPLQSSHRYSPSSWPAPMHDPPSSYIPPRPDTVRQPSVTNAQPPLTTNTAKSKEDAVMATIEKLLKRQSAERKAEPEDYGLAKLVQLLVEQQNYHVDAEGVQAKAAIELQLRQVQADRDKDNAHMVKLEELVIQQLEDQRAAEASWKAERVALDENMAKEMQKAKKAVERNVAATQATKKALKLARLQAEEKAQEDKVARAKEQQEKVIADYERRLDDYEKRMQQRQEDVKRNRSSPGLQPLRRTCLREGNRSIEVAEFTNERMGPMINTPYAPFHFFPKDVFNPQSRKTYGNQNGSNTLGEVDSRCSSKTSLDGMSTSGAVQKSRDMILLPSKVDRNSEKTLQLQDSLAKSGIEAIFDDAEESDHKQLVPYQHIRDAIPRSTIFWEPPMLGLRSELLFTMKKAGWKPFYSRRSNTGQTFFLGDEPIHSYIFRPSYKPQYASLSGPSHGHTVVVNSALVEKSAIRDLGFHFRFDDDTGTCILDGRLTNTDIDDLIERSFLTRETHFRKVHRQLPCEQDDDSGKSDTTTEEKCAPSLRSGTSFYMTELRTPSLGTQSQQRNTAGASIRPTTLDVDQYRTREFKDDVPSLRRGSTSTESPSIASWSSKTTNPYHRYMLGAKESKIVGTSTPIMMRSIWDDPIPYEVGLD